MSEPISRLRCISCGANYKTEQVRYRCDCGDLLEVIHDLDQIRSRYPETAGCANCRMPLSVRTSPGTRRMSSIAIFPVWHLNSSVFSLDNPCRAN